MSDRGDGALVVSTECPSCGARLDFSEAANAIRCAHCRSQLLVTGRGQLLSYSVRARCTGSEARSLVRFSLPGKRVGQPVLYRVPYYRVRAEELVWHDGDPEQERRRNVAEVAAWLEVDLSRRYEPETDQREETAGGTLRFRSRVLQRSFLARRTTLLPPSLGLRPDVLRLELFDRAADPAGTVVVAVDPAVGADVAAREPRVRARELLRVVRQIIYFPYWTVRIEAPGPFRIAVVDAVTGRIVAEDAEPARLDELTGGTAAAQTIGFRPLTCPNCGWDLPLRPDDAVFSCSTCFRAWLVEGERLHQVSSTVVAGVADAARHLPVWRLASGASRAVFAPAFRCRRLRALVDLGERLNRALPRFEEAQAAGVSLAGCALDVADARALARFILAGAREPSSPPIDVCALPAGLVWIPFSHDGYSFREPKTGAAIPRRSVEEGGAGERSGLPAEIGI